jgi:hypothetical protein
VATAKRDFGTPFPQTICAAGFAGVRLFSRAAPESRISRYKMPFRQKVLADILAQRSFNLFSQFSTLHP